ncbi:uncharacterized protein [Leuresthes tenuis]
MTEELEKFRKKQDMQAKAQETGDPGFLMVEFGEFKGRSMKEVYEDHSKEAQALINYLVRADARPNTNMALFKAYVLKRRTSASTSSAPPSAASTSSAPPSAASTSSAPGLQTGPWKTATVKALLARGKHLSPSQLAKKLTSPVKPSPAPQCPLPPPSKPPTKQLFSAGTSEDDDEELVSAAAQCEAQLNTEIYHINRDAFFECTSSKP